MVWLIDNLADAADIFGTVARTDPISLVLLAIGALLVAASAGAFGVLAIGGLLDWVVPETATQQRRP